MSDARADARTLRKRMLVARAGLERFELASRVAEVRAAVSTKRLVRGSIGKLALRGIVPAALRLMKQHSLAGSVASVALGWLRGRLASAASGRKVRGTAAALGLAVTGWQVWRLVRRHRAGDQESR